MARVVIVDDSLMIRTLLREILAGGGHEIVGEAPDGLQAEACVRRLRPDLVTLDLVMPVRGGLDSIPYLLDVDRSLAVVVCSASLGQRRVLAALRHALAFVISRNHAAAAGPSPAPPTAIPAGDRSSEQREFTRVTAALAVRVTPPDGRPLVTCTVDLSGNGLRLSSGNLALETRVEFRLELSAAEPPILGRARVARVDGDGRPALAFEKVSVADHERLNAYIQQHTPPSQPRPAIAP